MVAVVVTRGRRQEIGRRGLARAAVALLTLAAAGCGGGKPQVAQLPPPEVGVSRVVERDVTDFFETTGRTTAVESVEVRARVSGYLVAIGFKDGDEVKPGDVLFEIDPRPYEAQLLQAQGELARWEASKRKAEADLARNQRLLPTGAASQKELENAIAAKGTADAEIMSARGRLDQAQLNLEFSKVRAPIAGRVSKANVTVGNLVEASTLLTTVVSTHPMWMYFDIDERTMLDYRKRYRETHADAPQIPNASALQIPVEIGLANEDGFSRKGTMDFADNQVNPDTGTILARAVFANEDRSLSPGLFVRLRLPIGDPARSLLVSERAIGTDQGTKYVLVVNDQNVVEYRAVKLGPLSDGLRVIREGLKPGERVITAGLQRARPGITVKPQEAAAAGAAAAAAAAPAVAITTGTH
jgi:RND family efflux transporter MFP subunit